MHTRSSQVSSKMKLKRILRGNQTREQAGLVGEDFFQPDITYTH